ncbi:hypothetical protein [Nocardia sp. AG03]|uniref:hypothetical protein n=1 Tax=Nocardia sp. AG03 TaxID=3025312 RepID=UPI0024188A9A|nr:hypothetical protein [Nocardia sp. AG03]
MSMDRPLTDGQPRAVNTAVLLREAFQTLNDRVLIRLADSGHAAGLERLRADLRAIIAD